MACLLTLSVFWPSSAQRKTLRKSVEQMCSTKWVTHFVVHYLYILIFRTFFATPYLNNHPDRAAAFSTCLVIDDMEQTYKLWAFLIADMEEPICGKEPIYMQNQFSFLRSKYQQFLKKSHSVYSFTMNKTLLWIKSVAANVTIWLDVLALENQNL